MPKRKREFRWVKWLIFLVLIIAAVTVVILVKNNYFDKKPNNSTSQNMNDGKKEDKKDEQNSNSGDGEVKPEEKAPQYDGESPNKSETLTGLITYADVSGEDLIVRVNIDQYLTGGSCNLTMSRNGVTYYNKNVAIQESVTTSTCDGYKIPISELPKGELTVEINLESDGKSGKITGRVKI